MLQLNLTVISQKSFEVPGGFLGFPGVKKPGNLKTSKLILVNYVVQNSTLDRLLRQPLHPW